ncbi:hypothetical protein pb186bvf_012145 [Paramecium bursaria]
MRQNNKKMHLQYLIGGTQINSLNLYQLITNYFNEQITHSSKEKQNMFLQRKINNMSNIPKGDSQKQEKSQIPPPASNIVAPPQYPGQIVQPSRNSLPQYQPANYIPGATSYVAQPQILQGQQPQLAGSNVQFLGSSLQTGQVIRGESRIEYIPYERTVMEYEEVRRQVQVPVTRQVTEYQAIQYDIEYIPQTIQEKQIEYVPVEKYQERVEYITQTRQQIINYPQQDYQQVGVQQAYATQVAQVQTSPPVQIIQASMQPIPPVQTKLTSSPPITRASVITPPTIQGPLPQAGPFVTNQIVNAPISYVPQPQIISGGQIYAQPQSVTLGPKQISPQIQTTAAPVRGYAPQPVQYGQPVSSFAQPYVPYKTVAGLPPVNVVTRQSNAQIQPPAAGKNQYATANFPSNQPASVRVSQLPATANQNQPQKTEQVKKDKNFLDQLFD